MAAWSLPGPSGAGRQLGPRPGRRVGLLVDAEPLAELPTRASICIASPRTAPASARPPALRRFAAVRHSSGSCSTRAPTSSRSPARRPTPRSRPATPRQCAQCQDRLARLEHALAELPMSPRSRRTAAPSTRPDACPPPIPTAVTSDEALPGALATTAVAALVHVAVAAGLRPRPARRTVPTR